MTSCNENIPTLSKLLSQSEIKQFVAVRDVYRVLLKHGKSYIFKPARDADPANRRDAYIPEGELAVYEKFKYLQGKYILIYYGLATYDRVGLLMQDCGSKNLENPPQGENSKFLLFLRAMCAMERCLAAGLVHQDPKFHNIVYDPMTLQVRVIDIELPRHRTQEPQDVWINMNVSFSKFFGYKRRT